MAKQFLYHVTPEENAASILRDGIKRKGFAVYCSENPCSWYRPGLAIFRVRITGINSPMTTFLPESDEILIWGDVPPERVFRCNASNVIPRKVLQKLRRASE